MRIFDGILRVETVSGRRGPFNVGKLITDIGEFKVKDRELDQFEPGDYSGNFVVEQIYTASNPWRGGVFTEMLARIAPDGFMITDAEEVAPDGQSQAEPDPVDMACAGDITSTATVERSQATQAAEQRPQRLTNSTGPAGDDEQDLKLFGIEIHALFLERQDIALDPTVDREQFRNQRTRLKDSGYRFIAKEQRWTATA